jgi:PmbA protein
MKENDESLFYLESKLKENHNHHYEIYLSHVDSTSIEVKDQQIECFTTAQSNGLALRILKDNRMGFSYTTQFTKDSFEQVIARALTSARYASPEECNDFPSQTGPLPDLNLFDDDGYALPKEAKIEKLKMIEREALSYDKRITKIRKASYYEQMVKKHLINSYGLNLTHQDTLFSASIVVVAEEKEDSQTGWDFAFSRHYQHLETDSIGRAASLEALGLLGAQSSSSLRGPVVLHRSVSYQFLALLAQSFLAESVHKKKSLLRGQLHQKIFSDIITIIDDGLYPLGMATAPFDGEGVVRQCTPLVEQGVLIQFLYDTYCAKKDSTHSTGNASRGSTMGTPTVGYSNLFIQKGNVNPADMIASVEKGFLVNEVMGMHTANPITGDFSLGVTGFLIKNGKKTTPVKGLALAGNIITLFKNVLQVGNDLRFYGKVGSPTLLIESMEISGA